MKKLAAVLKQKLNGAQRIAVLGIGSDLRGDDTAGILTAEQINKSKLSPKIKVLIGATAPENLTSEIKQFNPSHLIIIDAADTNAPPGQITIIDPDKIGGTSFCTHSLPIKVMIDYLLQSLNELRVIAIGIQPKSIIAGTEVSKEVKQAAKKLAEIIASLF